MFKLELKSPDNRYQASKKQRLELRKWWGKGCVVGVIYSMKALKRIFKYDWYQEYNQEYYLTEENNCQSWAWIPGTKMLWRYRDFK